MESQISVRRLNRKRGRGEEGGSDLGRFGKEDIGTDWDRSSSTTAVIGDE